MTSDRMHNSLMMLLANRELGLETLLEFNVCGLLIRDHGYTDDQLRVILHRFTDYPTASIERLLAEAKV